MQQSWKKVVVCGGDAEFVMHMGGITTAGRDANQVNQPISYLIMNRISQQEDKILIRNI